MIRFPKAYFAVIVAALGYFVDIYDLLLFGIVRESSLKGIGIADKDLLSHGVLLLNVQMGAMLLGGIFWGILGDKRGRLSVLFGSISLYSLANIGNGFVTTMTGYTIMRFFAGLGLAGELGAGIALVSELLGVKKRGYGTTLVATFGILGAVAAALVARLTTWRVSYFIGGALGLILLLMRVGTLESGIFEKLKNHEKKQVSRGNFFRLFSSWSRAKRYISVITIALPIWYTIGILVTLSPEIGRAMGMAEIPLASHSIMYDYIGNAIGAVASGLLSQWFGSRKRVLLLFLCLTFFAMLFYFTFGNYSLAMFYTGVTLLGFATGYWSVFITVAAEQFGTNLRATATTSAPNFVRGAVIPLTASMMCLKNTFSMGMIKSVVVVGSITMILAFIALLGIEETYGKDLDFVD